MRFEVNEERPGLWLWVLRGSLGETIARSHAGYPSQVQASVAATAFARMVARAGTQVMSKR